MPFVSSFIPKKLRQQKLDLPELGEDVWVYVRELTAKEFGELQNFVKDHTSDLEYFCWLAFKAFVDENGGAVFQTIEHAAEVLHLPPGALKRIADVILEFSGLTSPNA